MEQSKMNSTPWLKLGLAVVLVILCLVVATGNTFSRYRTEEGANVEFVVREPLQLHLGLLMEDDSGKLVFQQTQRSWQWVDGNPQLPVVIANGLSTSDCEQRDQKVRVRLMGSLGILTGEETATITLTMPVEAVPEDPTETTSATEETSAAVEPVQQFQATAVPIAKDSPMYASFGDGWVFRFLDEEGEELSWTLPGGQLSWLDMTITLDNGSLVDTSLLQLQVTTELA